MARDRSIEREKLFTLRPLAEADVEEYSDLLFGSFNAWWWKHGLGCDFYECRPQDTAIFYDIYNDLTPGCSVAAFHKETKRMMGACFYHPRETHVSLGIMAVHPNYGRYGVAKALVSHILDYTREHGFTSCRLVNSAMNLDSFSLYNRAGFVPRAMFQDMVVNVPQTDIDDGVPEAEHVRTAGLKDVGPMGDLELEVSGIKREIDYRYVVSGRREAMHASVHENGDGGVDGFLFSLRHPAINVLGPCVARTEEVAVGLLRHELERFRGIAALMVVPMQRRKIVEQVYAWGGINVETHVKQVWGAFSEYNGIAMPSYLPETD